MASGEPAHNKLYSCRLPSLPAPNSRQNPHIAMVTFKYVSLFSLRLYLSSHPLKNRPPTLIRKHMGNPLLVSPLEPKLWCQCQRDQQRSGFLSPPFLCSLSHSALLFFQPDRTLLVSQPTSVTVLFWGVHLETLAEMVAVSFKLLTLKGLMLQPAMGNVIFSGHNCCDLAWLLAFLTFEYVCILIFHYKQKSLVLLCL